ncbi:hypothetical protein CR513_33811, partial [Mucuna pruriens]
MSETMPKGKEMVKNPYHIRNKAWKHFDRVNLEFSQDLRNMSLIFGQYKSYSCWPTRICMKRESMFLTVFNSRLLIPKT